jgi:hypothetical protein
MGNSRYEYRTLLGKHSFKCKGLCSFGTDCDVYCLMKCDIVWQKVCIVTPSLHRIWIHPKKRYWISAILHGVSSEMSFMISGNWTVKHLTCVSTKPTHFHTHTTWTVYTSMLESQLKIRLCWMHETQKNPYKLHDYSMRPTSKCLQTFLLLPTSALFPSKMRSESSRPLSFQNGLGAHGTIGYR